MGLLDKLTNRTDINAALRLFRAEKRAVLLDVRKPSEYATGHIPRSRNIPLDQIAKAESALPDKNMPLYVYCQKGSRAKKACARLEKEGYTNVNCIGGIETFNGKTEKGASIAVRGKNYEFRVQSNDGIKRGRASFFQTNFI